MASASAPPCSCALRGDDDVIDAFEILARLAFRQLAIALGADFVVEPQRQRDALAGDLDLQHLDLDDVAGLHHFARVLDEGFRHRRDVHQAVLVHADIDEGAEGRDVGHRAFEDHAALEVLDLLDAFLEHRGLERRTRIAAGLFQLTQDVGDRGQTKGFVDKGLRLQLAHDLGIADQRLDVALGCGEYPPHHRIGFRVHTG